jgi:hypothetical protein
MLVSSSDHCWLVEGAMWAAASLLSNPSSSGYSRECDIASHDLWRSAAAAFQHIRSSPPDDGDIGTALLNKLILLAPTTQSDQTLVRFQRFIERMQVIFHKKYGFHYKASKEGVFIVRNMLNAIDTFLIEELDKTAPGVDARPMDFGKVKEKATAIFIAPDAYASYLDDFQITGSSRSDEKSRQCTISIRSLPIDLAGLGQLSYVAWHEILCHIYQCSFSPAQFSNAEQDCHWTEAWMDKIAHSWCLTWSSEIFSPFLGNSGGVAILDAQASRLHQRRYGGPEGKLAVPGISDDAIKFRNWAVEAQRKLCENLKKYGFAATEDQAAMMVRSFSVLVNVMAGEPEIEQVHICDQLIDIFWMHSYRFDQEERELRATAVCVEFLSHLNVTDLYKNLVRCSGMITGH